MHVNIYLYIIYIYIDIFDSLLIMIRVNVMNIESERNRKLSESLRIP